jgi:formylglycine-generating enzyme required for sulfatase activity
MRMMVRVAVALVFLLVLPSAAFAQSRVALLIGNQSYNARVGPLKNPHNDIALIGAALDKLGFKTTLVKDADYRSVDAAIKRHVAMVRREGQGAISFVYYSGHGAADPDTKINYLIPVDVANADDEDLWYYSLNLNTLVEGLRAQAPGATHYVVFDACRNELNLTRKGQKALSDKGFVPMAYTPGVMVAYATAPGRTASDIGSSGGTYAKALAEEIVKPGIDSMLVFTRVARRVQREIGQDPFLSASTMPEIYFGREPATPRPVVTPSTTTAQLSEAAEAWDRTKDTTSIAALELFVASYKGTYYAGLARLRIDDLKAAKPDRSEMERAAAFIKDTEDQTRLEEFIRQFGDSPYGEMARARLRELRKHAVASPVPHSKSSPTHCQGVETLVANERKCLSPKDSFRDCPACPEMVVVPAGEFMMGSEASEAGRHFDEGPQPRVTIARPFAVGKFEITFAQWDACVLEGGCKHKPEDKFWGREKRPVINVSWNDAKEYVGLLTRKTGRTYRLLTEAEWEYSARAGTMTPFSTGRTITSEQANFNGNGTYGGSAKGQYRQRTAEVGSFQPNAFGLYDMHGNVWEWVEDCYQDSYKNAPTNGSARLSAYCHSHAIRGGSWRSSPGDLRSAYRIKSDSSYRDDTQGFRVARTLD